MADKEDDIQSSQSDIISKMGEQSNQGTIQVDPEAMTKYFKSIVKLIRKVQASPKEAEAKLRDLLCSFIAQTAEGKHRLTRDPTEEEAREQAELHKKIVSGFRQAARNTMTFKTLLFYKKKLAEMVEELEEGSYRGKKWKRKILKVNIQVSRTTWILQFAKTSLLQDPESAPTKFRRKCVDLATPIVVLIAKLVE